MPRMLRTSGHGVRVKPPAEVEAIASLGGREILEAAVAARRGAIPVRVEDDGDARAAKLPLHAIPNIELVVGAEDNGDASPGRPEDG